MKRLMTTLSMLALLAVPVTAQDDVYFVPKKKKVTTETAVPSQYRSTYGSETYNTDTSLEGEDWYVGRGTDVDVDAYNRRYDMADTALVDTTAMSAPYYYEEQEYEPAPTDLLVRFHGYYDPWYYSDLAWNYGFGMPWDWYYDPWYYGAWGRHGWYYTYSWARPYYGYYGYWGSPWYGHHYWGWNDWGWHGGWHHNYVHFNPDGSRGYQNRGGYRGGTRTTASRGGNAGVNGSRIGATGVSSPVQRGGYVGGNRTAGTSTNRGSVRTSTNNSGVRTGTTRSTARTATPSISTSTGSRSTSSPSNTSRSISSSSSSSRVSGGYTGGSRSSTGGSFSSGGSRSGGFSGSGGGGSRGGRR
ncbi:MAG: hypothetical protein MJZ54_03080 [Bacteroidaceae bacterium]|nr:hypothetical protein [Bacteroidaceae bacterium]